MAKQTPTPQSRRTTGTAGSARRTASTGTGTRRRTTQAAQSNVTFGFPWTKQNVIGIGAGIGVIVLGYILMSTGITADVANNDGIWNSSSAVTFGPILLAIGYCVIVPYFIFKRFRKDGDGADSDVA